MIRIHYFCLQALSLLSLSFFIFCFLPKAYGQRAITNLIDNEDEVETILPGRDGVVYYLTKKRNKFLDQNQAWYGIKYFDGHKYFELGVLPVSLEDYNSHQLFWQEGNLFIYHQPQHKNDTLNLFLFDLNNRTFKVINSEIPNFYPNAIYQDGNKIYSFSKDYEKEETTFYLYEHKTHRMLFKQKGLYDDLVEHNGLIFSYVKDKDWDVFDLNGNRIRQIGRRSIEIEKSSLKEPKLDFIKKFKVDGKLVVNMPYITPSLQEWDDKSQQFKAYQDVHENTFANFFMDSQGQFVSYLQNENLALNKNVKNYAFSKQGQTYQLDLTLGFNHINASNFQKCIFIGSKKGLFKIDFKENLVNSVLLGKSLRSIFPFDEDNLLIGTNSSGVYLLNRATYKTTPLFRQVKIRNDYIGNLFFYKDGNRELWGTLLQKIINYGTRADNYKTYFLGDKFHISHATMLSANQMLTTAYTSKIGSFNLETKQFKAISYPSSLGYFQASHIISDDQALLMGKQGVYRFLKSTMDLEMVDTVRKGILTCYTASDKSMWIGYESGLLEHCYIENNEIKTQGSYELGEAIATITPMNDSTLWLGTFNGVARFETNGGNFTFLNNRLLSNPECNRYSSYFDPKYNKLYKGTIDGLNIIDLKQYNAESKSHTLYFSSVTHADSDTILQENHILSDKVTIELPAQSRSCEITFFSSNINFDPEIKYFVKIDDQPWRKNEDKGSVFISYLKEGKHQVQVKATNSQNVTSNNTLTAYITVTPFFYQTLGFKLMVLLGLGVAFGYWFWRIKREKEKLKELVEIRTEELRIDKEIIENQAKNLLELDGMKNQFIANLSHELRTPLTLIMSPIKSLLKQESTNPRNTEILKIIASNATLMKERVNELLELSRLSAGKVVVKKEPITLITLVDVSVRIFEGEAERKGIIYIKDIQITDEFILGDSKKLSKIIQNLIGNAIKFTPPKGQVTVKINTVNQALNITVNDTGIGIPVAHQSRIFDRFYQIETDGVLSNPGTGIGLAMVKEYVTLLNGSVELQSDKGQGTSIRIKIPLILASSNLENLNQDVATPSPKLLGEEILPSSLPKLLIVEDNEDLRKYLRFILQSKYRLLEASNGEEAVLALRGENNIEIVLSDIMMPLKDGIALLSEVRKDYRTHLIPFVFLTAKYNDQTKIDAFRLGVDDYITKPFDEEELLCRLSTVYNNYKQRLSAQSKEIEPAIQDIQGFTKKLEQLVLSHLKDVTFSTSFLAEELGISRRQFIRIVQREIGLSPKDYIKEVRLHKARQIYLSGTYTSINDIAQQVGLNGGWYFNKLYFERFGTKLD